MRRGYDQEQVTSFLAAIATTIEHLEQEIRAAGVAARDENPGRTGSTSTTSSERADDPLAARVARLIADGEREAEAMLAEAKTQAAEIASETARVIEQLRGDAQREAALSLEEARVLLEHAKEDAGRTEADLVQRRRIATERLEQTKNALVSFTHDLELALDSLAKDEDSPELP